MSINKRGIIAVNQILILLIGIVAIAYAVGVVSGRTNLEYFTEDLSRNPQTPSTTEKPTNV